MDLLLRVGTYTGGDGATSTCSSVTSERIRFGVTFRTSCGASIAGDCGPTRAADEGRGAGAFDALFRRKSLCSEVSK